MDKFPIIYKRSPRFCGRKLFTSKDKQARKSGAKTFFGRKVFRHEPSNRKKNNTKAEHKGAGDMISIGSLTWPTFLSRRWHVRRTQPVFQQFRNFFFCNSTLQFHLGWRRLTGQQLDTKIEIFLRLQSRRAIRGIKIILMVCCVVQAKLAFFIVPIAHQHRQHKFSFNLESLLFLGLVVS